MSNYENNKIHEEIDLGKLFSNLWHGKIIIFICILISILFASLHLRTAVRKYTVEYRLKPVNEIGQNNTLSGFDGIASFAGVELPSGSSIDFKIYKELLTSIEVSERIFSNKNLIKRIYESEWNETIKEYSSPRVNAYNSFINNIKLLLIGAGDNDYTSPNSRRLAKFIKANINITVDKETNFLHLTAETQRPELIISLMIEVTKASDDIMRVRYINFSKAPLVFYKEKLRIARSREHREALAQLISKEEQKLMFASSGQHFVAEPYLKPIISLNPTSPKPSVVLLLSLIIGFFTGSLFVLIKKYKVRK